MFNVSIVDRFSCLSYSSQNIMNGSGGCVSFATLEMNTACAPYYVQIEACNKTIIYNRSITEIQGSVITCGSLKNTLYM